MIEHHAHLKSAVFITFSGNCKKALTFYQTCFGGHLQFKTFDSELWPTANAPILSGSLVSETIIIHGSDLVHNEGRKLGNALALYLHFESTNHRQELIAKLSSERNQTYDHDQSLIELTDDFEVRWVLGVG